MYVYRRKAQYHETDRMGIIHHANYIKWMEEARIEFMDSIGLTYRDMEDMGITSPVVSVNVEYKKQVEFGDKVEIRISVAKYDGAVLELDYEIYNITKDELCTVAQSRHCFLHDDRLVSLKKELPKLDTDLREQMEIS
jgi:acyl-CoA thioester hydrolase